MHSSTLPVLLQGIDAQRHVHSKQVLDQCKQHSVYVQHGKQQIVAKLDDSIVVSLQFWQLLRCTLRLII
jgi:hypothetical protein